MFVVVTMASGGSTLCCRCSCITYDISKAQNKVAAEKERDYPDSEELLDMMDFYDLGPLDVGKLYKIFIAVDEDQMGEISKEEFYALLQVVCWCLSVGVRPLVGSAFAVEESILPRAYPVWRGILCACATMLCC